MNGGNEAKRCEGSQSLWSRDGFSIYQYAALRDKQQSQSLWSRDGFSIRNLLGSVRVSRGRNPFGAGTVFQSEITTTAI